MGYRDGECSHQEDDGKKGHKAHEGNVDAKKGQGLTVHEQRQEEHGPFETQDDDAMAQAGTPEGREEFAAAQSLAQNAQLAAGEAHDEQPDEYQYER